VFSHAALESDVIDITLPADYAIDELPKNATYEYPSYKSEITASGHELHYTRTYELKDVRVPLEKMADLKKLYSDIADEERGWAILRVLQ
jgi:hypothetical protein